MTQIINGGLPQVKAQALLALAVDASGNAINTFGTSSGSSIMSPASTTDTAIVKWSGSSGGGLLNSATTIDASNNIVSTTGNFTLTAGSEVITAGNLTITNGVIYTTNIQSLGAGINIFDSNGAGGTVQLAAAGSNGVIDFQNTTGQIILSGTDFYPSLNSTFNLGKSANHFSKLYLDQVGNGLDILGNLNAVGSVTASGNIQNAISGTNDIGSASNPFRTVYATNHSGANLYATTSLNMGSGANILTTVSGIDNIGTAALPFNDLRIKTINGAAPGAGGITAPGSTTNTALSLWSGTAGAALLDSSITVNAATSAMTFPSSGSILTAVSGVGNIGAVATPFSGIYANQYSTSFVGVPTGSFITVNWNQGSSQQIDYTGMASGTSAITLSNGIAGSSYSLKTKNNAGGTISLAWSGSNTLWAGGYTGTTTATNGGIDLFTFMYDGSKYLGSQGNGYIA